MKKSLLLIASLLGIMSTANADDGITLATYGNATGNTTRTMTMVVTHTTNNYVAFQMDLTLPAGTTLDPTKITAKAPMKDGGSVTIDGTNYTTNFVFDGETQADGTYRLIGYNMGNDALAGTSGDICLTVPLTTSSAVDYNAAISVSNIIFVESAGLTGVELAATESYRLWGDANMDGKVQLSDVQAVALKVSNQTPATFDEFAADVNQDGSIKLNDVQSVANIVAGK